MAKLLALILLLVSFVFSAAPAWAHGDHEGAGVFAKETIEELEAHLIATLDESIRHGVNVEGADERRIGQLLLDAAYAEVIDELKANPPTALQKAGVQLKKIISGFNPIALGRWVLETARRQGPALAIAFGVSEVAEQVGVLLSAKYPVFLFLVPIYLTHTGDVVVFAVTLGGPKVVRALRVWQRHGGMFSGPGAYYRHLLAQRKILPIDWNEVIYSGTLESSDPNADLHYAVIGENFFERRLPRGLRVVLTPRKLAQRETLPTFGIWELEKLAKAAGLDLSTLRVFRGNKRMYSAILLREISRNEATALEFSTQVRLRDATNTARPDFDGVPAAWKRALAVDSVELFEEDDVEALQKHGETPDIVAQRLLWYLREHRERLFAQIKTIKKGEVSSSDIRTARRHLRRLGKVLEADRGLGRFASTLYPAASLADWEALLVALRQARGMSIMVEELLPPSKVKNCERLLLQAG